MKTFLIGAAAAGLVVTTAGAQSSSSQSSATTSSPDKSSTSQSASSQTGTMASSSKELSGVVKKIDKDKRSVKISSTSGGDQELKIADNATIVMRDGTQAALDQLKEGDEVRASLDPSSNQATKLEVQSKGKDKDKDKDKSKSDSKKY